MNFSQVCQEVLNVVKRPDKLNDIRREVNAAVSHFCTDASWEQNRAEAAVNINATQYSQLVALSGLTRFHRVWYLKRGGTDAYLNKLNTTALFANKCIDKRDTYYIVGQNINVNLGALSATLDIGYYQFPPYLTDAAPNFWMLEHLPFMVIDKAISKVFIDIGNAEEANVHEMRALAAYQSARRSMAVPH